MKKFVKLAIDIDKKNRKYCGECPWFEQSYENCSAFDHDEVQHLQYDGELGLYKRSRNCLRLEVKKLNESHC